MDHFSWNRGLLRGRAAGPAKPSHVNHGVTYFIFPLEVERLSGTPDTLNVVVTAEELDRCPVLPGETYEVTGEVRSFNNRSGVGGRLIITFFARTLAPALGEHANRLELAGSLCKAPVVRRTPLGRDICDLLLAVNRRYGRADYLPCIAWGALAHLCGEMGTGDQLALTGRLQSRKYRKVEGDTETERTAFEVSILTLEPLESEEE